MLSAKFCLLDMQKQDIGVDGFMRYEDSYAVLCSSLFQDLKIWWMLAPMRLNLDNPRYHLISSVHLFKNFL